MVLLWIKLILRGVPGNNRERNGNSLCRRCAKETETPSHVLGFCPFNSLLITQRHHKVKHAITNMLGKKGFECYEEVHAIDSESKHRFADIVAFKKGSNEAYILDPTIRFEKNTLDQASAVDQEKKAIYDSCIPYFYEKYQDRYNNCKFTVRALLFGARGTIYKEVATFLLHPGIEKHQLNSIAEGIIADSVAILHHHIYKNNTTIFENI